MRKIILASGSPRRSELLRLAEIPFEIIVSKTDEIYPGELSPSQIAVHIAKEKANAVKRLVDKEDNNNEYTIIAADTIVVLDDWIIGKPKDREDAIRILTALAGKKHKVITGVCIINNKNETEFAEVTEVEFHELTTSQLEHYVDTYKPYDKAGAYAIQEWIGVVGIKSITGDFYNVMGLPVSRVVAALKKE